MLRDTALVEHIASSTTEAADGHASLRAIIREIVAESETHEEATKRLVERVWSDDRLRADFIEPAVREGCYRLVGKAISAARGDILAAPSVKNNSNGARLREAAAGFLAFPLWDGTRLGEATTEQIKDTAVRYRKQADTMAQRAAWLARVAEKVPKGKRVSDVLTEAALEALWSDVES